MPIVRRTVLVPPRTRSVTLYLTVRRLHLSNEDTAAPLMSSWPMTLRHEGCPEAVQRAV